MNSAMQRVTDLEHLAVDSWIRNLCWWFSFSERRSGTPISVSPTQMDFFWLCCGHACRHRHEAFYLFIYLFIFCRKSLCVPYPDPATLLSSPSTPEKNPQTNTHTHTPLPFPFRHQPADLPSLWNGALLHHAALLACSLFHSSFFFFFSCCCSPRSLFSPSLAGSLSKRLSCRSAVRREPRATTDQEQKRGRGGTLANMATTQRDFIYVKSSDTSTVFRNLNLRCWKKTETPSANATETVPIFWFWNQTVYL